MLISLPKIRHLLVFLCTESMVRFQNISGCCAKTIRTKTLVFSGAYYSAPEWKIKCTGHQ